jgi:hypothetical protein
VAVIATRVVYLLLLLPLLQPFLELKGHLSSVEAMASRAAVIDETSSEIMAGAAGEAGAAGAALPGRFAGPAGPAEVGPRLKEIWRRSGATSAEITARLAEIVPGTARLCGPPWARLAGMDEIVARCLRAARRSMADRPPATSRNCRPPT